MAFMQISCSGDSGTLDVIGAPVAITDAKAVASDKATWNILL